MRDKALHALYLLAAVGLVGSGLYLLLDKAAPIVAVRPERPRQTAAPSSTPPAYDPRSFPAEKRSGPAIYRCDRGGSVVYSDAPCAGGRIVNVQVTQGFEAERYRPATRRVSESTSATPSAPSTAPTQEAKNAALCEQINKEIEALDAAARAGGSIQRMEELKERRRKLVDQRQQLNC